MIAEVEIIKEVDKEITTQKETVYYNQLGEIVTDAEAIKAFKELEQQPIKKVNRIDASI